MGLGDVSTALLNGSAANMMNGVAANMLDQDAPKDLQSFIARGRAAGMRPGEIVRELRSLVRQ